MSNSRTRDAIQTPRKLIAVFVVGLIIGQTPIMVASSLSGGEHPDVVLQPGESVRIIALAPPTASSTSLTPPSVTPSSRAAQSHPPSSPGATAFASPTPAPSPPIQIFGCAKNTTGGLGGEVFAVDTWAELVAAVASAGPRFIRASGTIDGDGRQLAISQPNVTIEGPASVVDAWVTIRTQNVILRNLRIRAGDNVSVDADAVNINGGSDVLIDHVEAVLAPDVGGITILNGSSRITVQHSIIGLGLLRSRHPESFDDPDGHGLAFNIAGLSSNVWPDCITVYRNLITHSQGRNPAVKGAARVDIVNNVIYNFDESPAGNPQSLNMVNNVLREGPAPETAGLGAEEHWAWRTQTSSDFPSIFSSSVYLSENVADGFTLQAADSPASVLRSTPAHTLSVTPQPVTALLDRILADVGPSPDATTNGWLADARNRTGQFWNGCGQPAPSFCP